MYVDDLVIIAGSLEQVGVKCAAWKDCMNIKGLRVNLANTKMVISDVHQGPTFTSCTQPGGICCKGVGFSLSFEMVVLTVCIINLVD